MAAAERQAGQTRLSPSSTSHRRRKTAQLTLHKAVAEQLSLKQRAAGLGTAGAAVCCPPNSVSAATVSQAAVAALSWTNRR